jgi:hypothetical protein
MFICPFMMYHMSKREEEKVVEAATRVAEQTRNVTQESINASLDETKRTSVNQ